MSDEIIYFKGHEDKFTAEEQHVICAAINSDPEGGPQAEEKTLGFFGMDYACNRIATLVAMSENNGFKCPAVVTKLPPKIRAIIDANLSISLRGPNEEESN